MKFSGTVGFYLKDVEVKPDVYKNQVIEKPYKGDIIRDNRRMKPVSNEQNDTLKMDNQIIIRSDIFFRENWSSVRYVVWNGLKLEVTDVQVGYPRSILSIGGVYNGETTD